MPAAQSAIYAIDFNGPYDERAVAGNGKITQYFLKPLRPVTGYYRYLET